jgi:cellulose biosynthesis protein BcsQ
MGTKPDNTQKFGHIIVLANQKGGSGKSTIAVHIAVALLRLEFKVAALDFDIEQQTFSRYLENRRTAARKTRQDFPTPALQPIKLDLDSFTEPDRKHFIEKQSKHGKSTRRPFDETWCSCCPRCF